MKIVTAQEMIRVEAMAYAEGVSEEHFMENAGQAVADLVLEFLITHSLHKTVILLVGKGNNGGDAYVAGKQLLGQGIHVEAWHLYPLESCSPLCQKMYGAFCAQGGIVHFLQQGTEQSFGRAGLLLDGLTGTGFHGEARGVLATVITRANASGIPILAIDLPSGLNATTGNVESVAIHAVETLFLEMVKSGCLLREGWNHVGQLKPVSFGLAQHLLSEAHPVALLMDELKIPALPPIKRSRHKYEAGYILAIAGSPGMSGAAILASYAALRTGAGMVRLFHPHGMEGELSGAPFALVREGWDLRQLTRIQEEAHRAKAMLIGPGIGRSVATQEMCHALLEHITLPLVVDADALFFLSQSPHWKVMTPTILTPHKKEMDRLLGHQIMENDYLQCCQAFVDTKGVTLVLKGAPTWIFHPEQTPVCMTQGDPGMATAGVGDVLTGMITALLAQGMPPKEAAILGVYLHGKAGEHAACALTSYGMIASDLLEAIPHAIHHYLTRVSH